uniref:Metabotropic glutamate receptor n=2 Tax=Daphnia magna TaxID=35525 RepID=A0A0P5YKL2_9CRUS
MADVNNKFGRPEMLKLLVRSFWFVVWTCLWLAVLRVVGQQRAMATPASNSAGSSIQLAGDIILGGLFPVHVKGEKTPCGSAVYNRGIQRLEAMLFAVDQINSEGKLLPGIRLGVNVVDTCSRDTYALNRSLEFIRASLNAMDHSTSLSSAASGSAASFQCRDGSTPRDRRPPSQQTKGLGPVFGVVGGSYSSVSIQVANLLRLFRIPQISPASTAKVLSDKSRFEFFARTVPPDDYQAITLVDLVERFNWTYISTVASEGSYGESGIEVVHREAGARNICIALAERVSSTADERVFDSIIRNLYRKPFARAVVLFTRADDARGLLAAAKRLSITSHFIWVASDGWGRQHKLVEGLEDVAEGALTVDLESKSVPGFDDYMLSLTPSNNQRNPWYGDYWQEVHGCLLPHNQHHPQSTSAHDDQPAISHASVCPAGLRLTHLGYEQDSKIQFVVDAVYAFAHAISALQRDVCGNASTAAGRRPVYGACPQLLSYDGGDFYTKYLLNVSFLDPAGSEVKFDAQGDGLARYTIMNYRRLPNGANNGYDYKEVGKWFNELELDPADVIWTREQSAVPSSVCSQPCGVGQVKITQQGDTCCWSCDRCDPWEYVENEFKCADCGPGRWPYDDKRGCFDLEMQYMRWDSLLAIVPICVSCGGILLTVTVISIFVRHSETPIVKASGRELSFVLLGGILLCYFNTFTLLAKPMVVTCAIQRLCVGTGFSIVYGALFTKTNRISRIFDSASRSAKRPSFISPKSQMVITSCIISFQMLGTVLWMWMEPPGIRAAYPQRDQTILKCRMEDSSFLLSQVFNVLLIAVCTVYAVKTRKIPENFNESKFIGFTMYTTCIIWLAFLPIYFGTANTNEIQITTMCLTISLSATVALVCLYVPKVYIIVFHPDKNVRKLTMTATYRKAPTRQGTATSSPPANNSNHKSSTNHHSAAGYCCDCGQEFSTGGEKVRLQQTVVTQQDQHKQSISAVARVIVAPVDQENSSLCNESAEETDTSKNNTPAINRRQHVVHVGLSSDGLLLDDHENVTLL